ncbi:c-type cytochrome [Thiomicrorhabdus sp. ZW0627]|uniref:c-type cytochrome n=1 Tax=Thiomicrorhabdus sp. ZW0627 TaxID=3039774 RepID=UPI0024367103|nr:c-type cytochrome [Thiomicrorhabdus sp. ZW0627]MDG6774098.1 c-type cytochrome [Thiomicrorhabdus sp. ZW0627]
MILLSLVSLSANAFASGHNLPEATAWTQIEWDRTASEMPQGDITRGAELHKTGLCITCHGEHGIAPSRNAPSLAGNTPTYIYKTLLDYQSGLRNEGDGKASVMFAATQPMSKQDMADLATYYATKTVPAKPSAGMDAQIDRLVRKGDVSRMITPCASCHGAHGEGHDEVPALAGQTAHYFVRTMHAYKNGHRKNDINEGMSQFTHDLTEAEIEALAEYYASLKSAK